VQIYEVENVVHRPIISHGVDVIVPSAPERRT
jgi:hypothetical protein